MNLIAFLLLLAASPPQEGPLEFGRREVRAALEVRGLDGRRPSVVVDVTGTGPPESYRIEIRGDTARVQGADPAGAMYGAMAMAERIRAQGRAAWARGPITARPFLADRGLNLFLTLPWDFEKNDTDYDPAALVDPDRWWFQNEDFWLTLLDTMAKSRLNWLDLHGMWDISVTDAPNLYAYFIQSDRYPGVGVAPEIKAKNLAQLNRVIAWAHARGIRVSLMSYEARLGIPHNRHPPYPGDEVTAYAYTREVVEGMIRGAPGLDALGFRIGESGRSGSFFRCYLEAAAASGREIPLLTRSWITRKAEVVPLARQARDFTVEIKYNGEHWGAPYPIAGGRVPGWYSYSFEDYLSDSGAGPVKRTWPGNPAEGGGTWPAQPYKIVWQVRANGTHRIFSFYDPEWVRRTVRSMKLGTATGFSVEPLYTYYPKSPRYYRSDPGGSAYRWLHQRDEMYLMLFGRLGYDPDTPDALFDRAAARHLGTPEPAAVETWKAASRVVPLAFCAYSLGPDHRSHAPELEWGGDTRAFVDREPFDSHAFLSVKEACARDALKTMDGRRSFQDAALRLDRLAGAIEAGVEKLEKEGFPPEEGPGAAFGNELLCSWKMLAHLARYYRARFLAASAWARAEAGFAPGGRAVASRHMADALQAWQGLSTSAEARFYKPFTERLRMHTNTFHWKQELEKVEAEAKRLAAAADPAPGGSARAPSPELPVEARLAWRAEAGHVLCTLPAAGLEAARLLVKPLPSAAFFHARPMTRKGERFVASFRRERWGHLVAAEVRTQGTWRRLPAWDRERPYLVVPALPGPTPPLYSSQEALTFLDPGILDPERYGLLLLCSRAWDFHRAFSPAIQRKLLDGVERGLRLLVLQQDYTSGRYPLTWLPWPPAVENRNEGLFDPGGALGLSPIEAPDILWQPFRPGNGWKVFGNGGVAMHPHGKGEVWMVQARLMQNMYRPACADALARLLRSGEAGKPVVVVDPGTEGAFYATSVFTDLLNGLEVPFLTLGEVVGRDQGTAAFSPVPGRPWDDLVLGGKGPEIMKGVLEGKVLHRVRRPLPASREEWERLKPVLRASWMKSMGLDPLPPKTPLNARVTGVLHRKGYRIEKIVYESRPRFPVSALLYVPDGPEGKKLPVIVNPHGHWKHKKAEPEVQSRAVFEALHGYLAMVVDSPGFSYEGDAPIERRYAGTHWDLRLIVGSANANAVYTWDLVRALDYLETRPEADMSRVGITGASGGGHATLSAFATDPRFRCAVPVCYATSFEDNFYNGCECNHVPGYIQAGDRAHVLALRAPSPVFVLGADDDWEFPPEGTRRTGEKLAHIYALYGKADCAQWRVFSGKHGYPKEMREAMMGFFDLHLRGRGDGSPVPEPELSLEDPEAKTLSCMAAEPEGGRTMRDIARGNLVHAGRRSFEEMVELNGGWPPFCPLRYQVTIRERQARWFTFESEPGLTVPGILRLPEGRARAAVVLLAEGGKTEALQAFPVEALVKKGFACLLPDLRGFGELQGLDPKLMAYLGTGDPFAMGYDAARCAEAALAYSPRVAVVGRGCCGAQAALFAAYMESRVVFVAGLGGIRSWEECLEEDVPIYAIQPRACCGATLEHLRASLDRPALWTFRGEVEPDLVEVLDRVFP